MIPFKIGGSPHSHRMEGSWIPMGRPKISPVSLDLIRFRTLVGSIIVELDAVLCEPDEWEQAKELDPSFRLWRSAPSPRHGLILAIEPASATISRLSDSLHDLGRGKVSDGLDGEPC